MIKAVPSPCPVTYRVLSWMICLWLCCMGQPLRGQSEGETTWTDLLEQLAVEGEEQGWEDELEQLNYLRQHPINLNTATRQELEQIPFLSDEQIEELQAYVYLNGPMQSLGELQAVRYMNFETIRRITPYCCVLPTGDKEPLPRLQQIARNGRHQLLTRLDIPLYSRKGYQKEYLGPPLYHSLRYSFRYGNRLKAGLTAEKDAGEPLFALHNRKGYDYYSPYLLLNDWGPVKCLALGNYRLSYGLGLVLGSGFLTGKSFSLSTATFRNNRITAHSSTDEYNYFSGAALRLEPAKRWEVTAFYSYRNLEGTRQGDTISAIYTSGLHRTAKEADKRGAFHRQDVGGDLTWRHRMFRVGITGLYTHFSFPYVHHLPKYARYYPQGSRFYNLSAHYEARWRQLLLSGESALGKQGYALLHRLDYTPSSESHLLLVHRMYSHDYWAWHARAFGEGSQPRNENGWYLAAETIPWAHWRLFGSVDFYSHPWWRYRVSKPSQGFDGMMQAAWQPREALQMTLNYRYKRKERDVTGTGGADIRPLHHHRTRLRTEYTSTSWQWMTQADYNHFHLQGLPAEQGWELTQRLTLTPKRFPLQCSLQGSYFSTTDYDSRVYIYERGMLNSFYIPSFYGRGWRCSLHLRYDYKQLALLAKWGGTDYLDRDEIGSGNDLIASHRKDDIQLQLRWQF